MMNSFKITKKDILISKKNCHDYRKRILDISQKVSALHIGGAFSCLEILNFIYSHLLSKKKTKKDLFILSKGHSAIAQYVILESMGILKKKDLDAYCTKDGILGCHPDIENSGINASTGSLGHGLGMATGIAHAFKINKTKQKCIVVLSDGELQEGSTWESLMMAANLELDNLIIFLDHNGSQSFGHTKNTHPKFYPIFDKIKSFQVACAIAEGHNIMSISKSLNKIINKKSPKFIICNTIKGKGVSFMEGKPIWHYRSPTADEYNIALRDIKKL